MRRRRSLTDTVALFDIKSIPAVCMADVTAHATFLSLPWKHVVPFLTRTNARTLRIVCHGTVDDAALASRPADILAVAVDSEARPVNEALPRVRWCCGVAATSGPGSGSGSGSMAMVTMVVLHACTRVIRHYGNEAAALLFFAACAGGNADLACHLLALRTDGAATHQDMVLGLTHGLVHSRAAVVHALLRHPGMPTHLPVALLNIVLGQSSDIVLAVLGRCPADDDTAQALSGLLPQLVMLGHDDVVRHIVATMPAVDISANESYALEVAITRSNNAITELLLADGRATVTTAVIRAAVRHVTDMALFRRLLDMEPAVLPSVALLHACSTRITHLRLDCMAVVLSYPGVTVVPCMLLGIVKRREPTAHVAMGMLLGHDLRRPVERLSARTILAACVRARHDIALTLLLDDWMFQRYLPVEVGGLVKLMIRQENVVALHRLMAYPACRGATFVRECIVGVRTNHVSGVVYLVHATSASMTPADKNQLLMEAVMYGAAKVVKLMLKVGATASHGRNRCLKWAARLKHRHIMDVLLSHPSFVVA